jgi:aquaporin Z
VLSQCIGAIIGAAILLIIASGLGTYSLKSGGLGLNGYGTSSPAGYSLLACFFAEVVFTFLFVLVVVGSTRKQAPKGFAGLAIGLALTFVHLVTIPITDTSVNPARSIGPAVVTALREWSFKPLSDLWLFIVAPLVGGILAAFLWKYVLETEQTAEPEVIYPDSPEDR